MGLDNMPSWWVIVLALGMFLLLVYWDAKARSKRLRWARLMAIFLAVSSLLGLYIAPYVSSQTEQVQVVWITKNSNQSVLDSLQNQGFESVESRESYEEIRSKKDIRNLIVIGDGLEQWELDKVDHIDDFLPSKQLNEGVIDFALGNAIEQSTLSISLALHLYEKMTIIISGTGIVPVAKESDKNKIQLEVLPTVSGYLTYRLDALRAGDTLFSETIPVHVAKKQPSNVLMISNTPSFEFRGLKNYLAEAGFGIAERLRISTDLFHQSFTNMEELRLATLSKRLLDDFQLIVIDAEAYQDLSKAEQQRIQSALEIGNLGMVLMGERSANNLVSWKARSGQNISLVGENGELILKASKWQLDKNVDPIYLAEKIIAQTKSIGLGRIVRPLFSDSYALKLQGENGLYARLWQTALKDVIGKIERANLIQPPDFAYAGEPMDIQINEKKMEQVTIGGIRVAPSQEWIVPNTWRATYWPQRRGWQTVAINEEEIARFFAYDSLDWMLQKRLKMQKQTATFVETGNDFSSYDREVKTPVSKWLFFSLFLMGITFLWVEQRVG